MSTVADVVVDGLARAGTPRIFGVPGVGASLLAAARARGLPLVPAYGESAACVMAAVTGDLAEAPGAVAVGPGPGIAAAVTGAAQATLNRSPVIFLTDRHPGTMLACKASLGVTAASAADAIARAARLAMTEPRGPVHLDVPPAVADEPAVEVAASCRPAPLAPPERRALDEAAALVASASRPVLVAGLGCRAGASAAWLRALAEALPAPVLVTPKAKGALPDPHPLMLGVLASAGAGEPLLGRADLIVALGLDAVEANPGVWPSTAPLLHLAPFPAAADCGRPVTEMVGEIGLVVEELAPRLHGRARADWDVAELDRLKRDLAARRAAAGFPYRAVRLAREATEAGTIAAVDAGPHADGVTALWDAVAPGEFLISNGPATAGFALPAAIAAHLARPERRVVCFTTAAGLVAAASELETAMRLRAPIVVVAFGEPTAGAPDLVRLAQSFGVPAFAADGEARFGEAMSRALQTGGPALIAVWP
ncbi:MAG: thiamine pyrophosphate-binding protein [Candidatus Rokubacteria bacterium]|nr:thiamine pyrophosphate-binding protein [Candidatus Rokubacteria bacterium]